MSSTGSWLRIVLALALTPLATALFAGVFCGPLYSFVLWNFGGLKSAPLKLLMPVLGIALWGTLLFWGFSLFAAVVTQLPLVLLNRWYPISLIAHALITIGSGLLLFWFVFPFPLHSSDILAGRDGGPLVRLLLGLGGSVGLTFLWRWLVFSRLSANA